MPAFAVAAPDAHLGPDTARFRLYDAVLRLCRQSTVDSPMVAVLDDIHVADPSSLLLLQFLAGHLDEMGLLVVATYRDVDIAAEGFSTFWRSSSVNATRRGCASVDSTRPGVASGDRRRDRRRSLPAVGRTCP